MFRVLLFVGFVVTYWWLILAALAVVVAAGVGWWCCMQGDAADERRRREHAGLIARADQQHAWVFAGDDRGVYGEYAPADGVAWGNRTPDLFMSTAADT
jgi:hypothetical protein